MIYMASRLLNPITGGVKNISNVSSLRFRDESENLCKESKILGHPIGQCSFQIYITCAWNSLWPMDHKRVNVIQLQVLKGLHEIRFHMLRSVQKITKYKKINESNTKVGLVQDLEAT